jgi:hypothetical protein
VSTAKSSVKVVIPVTASVPVVETFPVVSATVNTPSTSIPASKEARPEALITPKVEVPVTPKVP